MTRPSVLAASAAGLLALAAAVTPAAAQGVRPAPPVQIREQFTGVTRLRDGDSVRVAIRTWSIAGGQRIAALELPFRGLAIVELRAGSAVTVIDGRRTTRREGELWVVPAGTPMGVETDDDMAVVQVTVVEGG
jgi:quercetin dioxygenase-like cupin family protein